jgi:hypothetical protein
MSGSYGQMGAIETVRFWPAGARRDGLQSAAKSCPPDEVEASS